jgi:hypothetical protein
MRARKHNYAGLCALVLCASLLSGCLGPGAPTPIPLAQVLHDDAKTVSGPRETLVAQFHAASIGADNLRGHLSVD